jgi:PTS system mannose-specific IIA component
MVGVVVVTHGNLASQLLATVAQIAGELEQARAVAIDAAESMDQIRERMLAAMNEVDTGQGVLILTDMFGGTPSNLALSLLDKHKIEVVTGCNLPMILKLATARAQSSLAEVAKFITAYGQKNIVLASGLLAREEREDESGAER